MKNLLTLFIFLYTTSIIAQENINHYTEGKKELANYQFKKALDHFKSCQTTTQTNKDIAYCYFKLGQFNQSMLYYNKVLEEDSQNINALNQLANIFSKTYDYKSCISQYQKLIEIDSTNSYYHKRLANYAIKSNKEGLALYHLNKSYKLNQDDFSVLLTLTELHTQFEEYDIAKEYLTKGFSIDSLNSQLLTLQTKIAYKQKNYPIMIESLTKSLSLQGDTSVYQLKLLGIAYYHINRFEESIDLLEKSLICQQSDIVHFYLGLSYQSIDSLTKSKLHFERAITTGITDNIDTYYSNLASVLEKDGNHEDAIKAYQTAYNYSENKVLLFHLAKNYDYYYADKQTALTYYELYLAQNDTGNKELINYSKFRINKLKESIHFSLDSID